MLFNCSKKYSSKKVYIILQPPFLGYTDEPDTYEQSKKSKICNGIIFGIILAFSVPKNTLIFYTYSHSVL